MAAPAPPQRAARAAADAFVDSSAAVLCRQGKIVWASPAAAERLTAAGVPTIMGARFDKVLRKWGEFIDEGDAGEILALPSRRENVSLPRLVRIERHIVDGFEAEAGGGALELCVMNDLPSSPHLGASRRDDLDRLERANKEIKQDRDELIAILSHELRTPLTVISGYSKLLLTEQAGELSHDQRRYLEASRTSCERLNELVVDLLDASHDHGGAICLRLECQPIESLIRDVTEFFAPAFEENDLEVEIEIEADLADAHFDPMRIEQVLTNLVGNAIKYTRPSSAVQIQARETMLRDVPGIEVAVQDQGTGIAEADRERVFEPYVRARQDDQKTGIGLGLAISRRILEAHRGTIGVEAAPGGGSRFHFWIPARGQRGRGES